MSRCNAPSRGLIRTPASRSIGSASSAIGGYGWDSTSSIASRAGLNRTRGGWGASRIAAISAGGSLYGVCAGAVAGINAIAAINITMTRCRRMARLRIRHD